MTRFSRKRCRAGPAEPVGSARHAGRSARAQTFAKRLGGANRATARGRNEPQPAGALQRQRPLPCSCRPPRPAGRKRNRRCRCNRFGRGSHRHGCCNPVPAPRPDQWMQPHAKTRLPTRHGRPSKHGQDLTLKRQVPAAAPGNASGPASNDTDPFCAAMSSLATCDSLPWPTDLLPFSV